MNHVVGHPNNLALKVSMRQRCTPHLLTEHAPTYALTPFGICCACYSRAAYARPKLGLQARVVARLLRRCWQQHCQTLFRKRFSYSGTDPPFSKAIKAKLWHAAEHVVLLVAGMIVFP